MKSEHNDQLAWFVACPRYIEPLLADELTALGATDVKVSTAGVAMTGDLAQGYRVALWSRLASRLTLQLAEGKASSADELKALLDDIPWESHMRPNGSLRVRFIGRTDTFRNTQYGAQWVKDQIVDYFQALAGVRPDVSRQPDITLVVKLHKDRAQVGVELNSESLHQRAYRAPRADAPVRENLAAAVLIRAGWPQLVAASERPLGLIDPMCGSGTLLIEAAMMAFDWAPGLARTSTLAERWPGHDLAIWEELLKEAEQRRQTAMASAPHFEFWGNDVSQAVFQQARHSWRSLGLPEARWTRGDVSAMPEPMPVASGLVLTNPPYGERLDSEGGVATLYQSLGTWMKGLPEGYRGALLLPETASVSHTGLFYDKTYRLMNGDIECRVYTFPTLAAREVRVHSASPDLANRLRKNLRKLKPFLQKGETDAYRVYDADLPEYAIAVDRYADWLHVQEYAAPATIPEHTAQQRLSRALVTLAEVFELPEERIVVKQRRRQKGIAQYEKQGSQGAELVVREHGLNFKVNLTDYLDTGLFLDHRPMRYWLQTQARGARVLNLFCYTGAASVHAAAGGAVRVDSVDLSATYLSWAKDNFRLNHLTIDKHGFIQADVLTWLHDCESEYDLIFLDPPTFSNSKRMDDDFDVQRDHPALIRAAMKTLKPGGTLVFSNNYRRFKLDASIAEDFQVTDQRLQSIPADFHRSPRIHGCWFIRRQ